MPWVHSRKDENLHQMVVVVVMLPDIVLVEVVAAGAVVDREMGSVAEQKEVVA